MTSFIILYIIGNEVEVEGLLGAYLPYTLYTSVQMISKVPQVLHRGVSTIELSEGLQLLQFAKSTINVEYAQ